MLERKGKVETTLLDVLVIPRISYRIVYGNQHFTTSNNAIVM